MDQESTYLSLVGNSEGLYKEKGSKFLAFAFPVKNEEEIKEKLLDLRKKYHDARHHCYAYMLGKEKDIYRANDDGEPIHSAGDPILGQIRSNNLTNVLIVVVRYFGGTKLGVSGLIQAYKTAAQEAILANEIIEKEDTEIIGIFFSYPQMNAIMSLVKEFGLEIKKQEFAVTCYLEIEVPEGKTKRVKDDLSEIVEVRFKEL